MAKKAHFETLPVRQPSRTHRKPVRLPALLANHVRWVFVLGKLKQLRDHTESFDDVAKSSDVESLFDKTDSSDGLNLDEDRWKGLFMGGEKPAGGRGRPKASFLPSVYQCRCFYGLNAPNNVSQRFLRMVRQLDSQIEDDGKSVEPSAQEGKYDRYVNEWGRYAQNLVRINGGWKAFIAKTSLDISDFWPGSARRPAARGTEHDSLIQRILALEDDKYVQLLAAPVAVQWVVWFLRNPDNRALLQNLSASSKRSAEHDDSRFTIGPALPQDDSIYVDVNTSRRCFQDLPFPFGYAANCLRQSELATEDDDTWSFEAVNEVASALGGEFWNPPILFAARGSLWERPADKSEARQGQRSLAPSWRALSEKTVAFLQITRQCDIFASVFRRDGRKKPKNRRVADERVSLQRGSFAEEIAKDLGLSAKQLDRRTTPQMLDDDDRGDSSLILAYFPLDLLIQTNEDWKRLTPKDLLQEYYPDDALELMYSLGPSVLAGGRNLSRQLRMRTLLQALGLYLAKAEAVARYLAPLRKNVQESYQELRSGKRTEKKAAAGRLREKCADAVLKLPPVQEGIIEPDFLPRALEDIGKSMIESILGRDVGKKAPERSRKAIREIEDWGWAALLEYVDFCSVYLSAMLYSE